MLRAIPVLCLLFLLVSLPAAAKTYTADDWSVATMPLELLGEADALIRNDYLHFVVRDERRAQLHVKRVVTILKPAGRDFGKIVVPYNRFTDVGRIRGTVYDASGDRVKRLGRRDYEDYSTFSGITLYHDNRHKVAELYHDQYPYTVEYEYTISYNGMLSWPRWMPHTRTASVQSSTFEVDIPASMDLRYHLQNTEALPEQNFEGNRKNYKWEAQDLVYTNPEPYSPAWHEQVKMVRIAPNQFEIDGYYGSMQSWEEFGKWYHLLSQDRDVLPEPVKTNIRSMISEAETDLEKIDIIYKHLQDYTRYVSIALGIGGWQTMSAIEVANNRYGDCKALTNYLMCMLDVAGIKSYPALINSGTNVIDIKEDFPNNEFNHVILYVPLEGETLWLESTSSNFATGYIGLGNEDRYALLTTAEGGKLVRTPASDWSQNTIDRNARVTITQSGDAEATMRSIYAGSRHETPLHVMNNFTGRDRDRWVRETIRAGRYELLSHELKKGDAFDKMELSMSLRLPGLASRAGSRLIIQPNIMAAHTYALPEQEERTHPLRFQQPFKNTDTTVYHLPEGFAVEGLPKDIHFTHTHGSYSSRYTLSEDKRTLTHQRVVKQTTKEIEPELYNEYRDFANNIRRVDNARVVLVDER